MCDCPRLSEATLASAAKLWKKRYDVYSSPRSSESVKTRQHFWTSHAVTHSKQNHVKESKDRLNNSVFLSQCGHRLFLHLDGMPSFFDKFEVWCDSDSLRLCFFNLVIRSFFCREWTHFLCTMSLTRGSVPWDHHTVAVHWKRLWPKRVAHPRSSRPFFISSTMSPSSSTSSITDRMSNKSVWLSGSVFASTAQLSFAPISVFSAAPAIPKSLLFP